jgi:hypothetical protein
MSETIDVTCPHCGSSLKIDVSAGVVVAHEPPPERRDRIDFDTRLKQMEEEKRRAASRMDEAMRKEKSRDRILEDRFRELMDKAKDDDGSRPIRDIDLD